MLRIAVPNKGSLSEPAVEMLREAGYRQRRDSRELVLADPDNDVEFFFLRPRDIAVYVGSGTVDVGITGRDLLLDSGADAVEHMQLGFGGSTFRYAAPAGTITSLEQVQGLRVATSYEVLVEGHLRAHGVEATVVHLDGAVESAVQLGVAEVPLPMGVGAPVRRRPATVQERRQLAAVALQRHLDPDPVEDRGHDVDNAHLLGDDAGGDVGAGDDERNPHRAVVDEKAVLLLAVFAERLAVIGHDHDNRAIETSGRFELLQQTSDQRVGGRNLTVVRPLRRCREPRSIRLRRRIRTVGIVKVHPREERRLSIAIEPCERVIDDFAAGTLRRVEPGAHLEFREIEVVEILVEALSDAPASIEDERSDEAAGAIAAGFHRLGQRGQLVVDIEAAVVAHAVKPRKGAGQQ